MATVISMNPSIKAQRAFIEQDLVVQEIRRGKLLYKLLGVFLLLSIGPLLVAGYQLIRVGDNYIQKQIIGVKLGIAQKEGRESLYWLRLLSQSELVPKRQLGPLTRETEELVRILASIILTTKQRRNG